MCLVDGKGRVNTSGPRVQSPDNVPNDNFATSVKLFSQRLNGKLRVVSTSTDNDNFAFVGQKILQFLHRFVFDQICHGNVDRVFEAADGHFRFRSYVDDHVVLQKETKL